MSSFDNERPEHAKLPPKGSSSADFDRAFADVDWDDVDVPALRDALVDLEHREGITEIHRRASRALASRTVLLNPAPHERKLVSCALSPNGRHLAVGSWISREYDRGGVAQIWDMTTGSCVNVIDDVCYGLGSHVCERSMQWSRDGRHLAMEFNGSMVGKWDPAEANHEWLADAHGGALVGCPNPVGFTLFPDGDRVFVHCGDDGRVKSRHSGVNGAFEPLRQKHFDGFDSFGESPESELLEPIDAALSAQLGAGAVNPDYAEISADGRRMWGSGSLFESSSGLDGRDLIFCVDLERNRLQWVIPADGDSARGHATWETGLSPDETLLAGCSGGRLRFFDPVTGDLIAEHDTMPGTVGLEWAGTRLAVVGGTVQIYDGTQHLYDLDVRLKKWGGPLADAPPWSTSPDGRHAVCLSDAGQVMVWELGDEPVLKSTTAAPDETAGVFFGAENMIAVIGEQTIRFTTMDGRVVSDHILQHEPGTSPFMTDGMDEMEWLRPRPVYPVGDDTWLAVFTAGVVVAPGGSDIDLDRKLAWSIDRHHGWPLRWLPPRVVDTVAQAVPHLDDDSRAELVDFV